MYYQRKLAEAKTPEEARRRLKRHLATVVYGHLVTDHEALSSHAGRSTHARQATHGMQATPRPRALTIGANPLGATKPDTQGDDAVPVDRAQAVVLAASVLFVKFLYILKAGPAGGRLRRLSSARQPTSRGRFSESVQPGQRHRTT